MDKIGDLIVMSHVFGCLQVFISSYMASNVAGIEGCDVSVLEHPPTSEQVEGACSPWPAALNGTLVNGTLVIHLTPENLVRSWIIVFYHGMTQLLALGEGVFPPTTFIDRSLTLLTVLCGALIFAALLSAVATASMQSNAAKLDFQSKLNTVRNYIKHYRLSKELSSKLLFFYQFYYPGGRLFDERQIFAEVSTPLRQQLSMHACGPVLATLGLLVPVKDKKGRFEGWQPPETLDQETREKDARVLRDMAEAITQVLQRVVFLSGDCVLNEGQRAMSGMIFIHRGYVEVSCKDKEGEELVVATLHAGDFFGEGALLSHDQKASATVR